jgi:hypothetical protein
MLCLCVDKNNAPEVTVITMGNLKHRHQPNDLQTQESEIEQNVYQ